MGMALTIRVLTAALALSVAGCSTCSRTCSVGRTHSASVRVASDADGMRTSDRPALAYKLRTQRVRSEVLAGVHSAARRDGYPRSLPPRIVALLDNEYRRLERPIVLTFAVDGTAGIHMPVYRNISEPPLESQASRYAVVIKGTWENERLGVRFRLPPHYDKAAVTYFPCAPTALGGAEAVGWQFRRDGNQDVLRLSCRRHLIPPALDKGPGIGPRESLLAYALSLYFGAE